METPEYEYFAYRLDARHHLSFSCLTLSGACSVQTRLSNLWNGAVPTGVARRAVNQYSSWVASLSDSSTRGTWALDWVL